MNEDIEFEISFDGVDEQTGEKYEVGQYKKGKAKVFCIGGDTRKEVLIFTNIRRRKSQVSNVGMTGEDPVSHEKIISVSTNGSDFHFVPKASIKVRKQDQSN